MSDAGPTPPDELDDAACQRALATLVAIGLTIAKQLQTATPNIPHDAAARAKAFDAVALAVRRTIILSQHIRENPATQHTPETKRAAARRDIIRAVEDTIENKADPAEAPALRVELLERIDSLDFVADLLHRPRRDLIQELCRDLGLAKAFGEKFPRRTPDDIAILCAQAAAPSGSGLPQWLAATTPQAHRNDTAATNTPLKER